MGDSVLIVVGVLWRPLVVAMLTGGGTACAWAWARAVGRGDDRAVGDPGGWFERVRRGARLQRNYGRFAVPSGKRGSRRRVMRVDEFAYSKRCLGWRIARTLTRSGRADQAPLSERNRAPPWAGAVS